MNQKAKEARMENKIEKKFYCEKCDHSSGNLTLLVLHLKTKKHITMDSNRIRCINYGCKICKFLSKSPRNLRIHLQTNKHRENTARHAIVMPDNRSNI